MAPNLGLFPEGSWVLACGPCGCPFPTLNLHLAPTDQRDQLFSPKKSLTCGVSSKLGLLPGLWVCPLWEHTLPPSG